MIIQFIEIFSCIAATGALFMSWPTGDNQPKWAGVSALFLIAAAICFK